MLRPVGDHTPAVYWRRRLMLCAAVALAVVLLVLTFRAVFSGDTSTPLSTHSSARAGATSATVSNSSAAHGGTTSAAVAAPGSTASAAPTPASGAHEPDCQPSQLTVAAVTDKPTYAVGAEPVLGLQMTNRGTRPCVQNVADTLIELRVYNGASRVWGSHDCRIEPGITDRTLLVNTPASFTIKWTGLTSTPDCTGQRQRVGSGVYTLHALLAGHEGATLQFTIE